MMEIFATHILMQTLQIYNIIVTIILYRYISTVIYWPTDDCELLDDAIIL